MKTSRLFEEAHPYQDDVLALPVEDLDAALNWYSEVFGLELVERSDGAPNPKIPMERDGVRIGFAVNGKDPTVDGAAIRVSDIESARTEIESKGIDIGNWRIDERDGTKFQVFFVVAPDGLCYYFHQPLNEE